jgi:putative transcriptional regulator
MAQRLEARGAAPYLCDMAGPRRTKEGSGAPKGVPTGRRATALRGGDAHLTGRLLIAMPGMPDARFARSVIYLCAHSDDGAMGIVVNQLADDVRFPTILEQLGIAATIDVARTPVHVGGPVERGRGFVLHSPDYTRDSTLVIDEHFALTATVDILRAMAVGEGPRRAVFALGYAGWAPRQLDQEIQKNGWLVAPGDAEVVYAVAHDQKWTRALRTLGVDPGLLSTTAGRA